MGIIIYLLAAFAAFTALKRRSILVFIGAGELVLFGLVSTESDTGIFYTLFLMLTKGILLTAGFAAVSALIGYAVLKATGSQQAKDFDPVTDMNLVVGRVLDTQSTTTVFSDTTVSRNAMGHLDSHTSHDVQVTHNTWLHDLNKDLDVNYSGDGKLQARPGHILGTMSWSGRTLLDINFSTRQRFCVEPATTNILASGVWAAILLVMGWAIFPVFALLSPLVWMGVLRWNGNGGVITTAVAPGSHKLEAIFVYGGGLAYLLAIIAFQSWDHGRMTNVGTIVTFLFITLVALHQYVVRMVKIRHLALLEQGEAELNRLYKQAEAKYEARAAALAQQPAANATPVAAQPVAS